MIWQGDQEMQASSHSLNVSLPDYFSVVYSRCMHTSKETFHFSRTEMDSVTSFFLVLQSCLVFRRVVATWDSTLKGYIIQLFSCYPPPLPYLRFIPLLSSIPSSSHIFCFCICGGNNSDGRRDLPADPLIIHHSLFVRLYAMGESAATWVSEGEPAPRLWGWLRGHLWSSGKWTAVQLLACCQTSYLLARLPATSNLGPVWLEC